MRHFVNVGFYVCPVSFMASFFLCHWLKDSQGQRPSYMVGFELVCAEVKAGCVLTPGQGWGRGGGGSIGPHR